jgi:hypothetical protein
VGSVTTPRIPPLKVYADADEDAPNRKSNDERIAVNTADL